MAKGSLSKSNSRSLFKDNKASIADAIPLMFVIFVFAIGTVIAFVIYDGMRDNGLFTTLDSQNSAGLENNMDVAFDMFDVMGLLLFVGTTIAAILGALLIRSHPAFFFISILAMLIQIVVAVALGNTWNSLINTTAFDEAQTQFTLLDFIIGNFPIVIFGVLLILAVVIYAINPFGVE